MKKNIHRGSKAPVPKEAISTKQLILDKANQMINSIGVVDFRIDKLASSLGLSPGNITYHFPKKENISNALWDQYLAESMSTSEYYKTSLFDIKQLYLFSRTIALAMVKYKGVICYKLGDIGVIDRAEEKIAALRINSRKQYDDQMLTLEKNGYCKRPQDKQLRTLTFKVCSLVTYWWINHSILCYPGDRSDGVIDHYAFLMIYPLRPFLTEKGLHQFDNILGSMKNKHEAH